MKGRRFKGRTSASFKGERGVHAETFGDAGRWLCSPIAYVEACPSRPLRPHGQTRLYKTSDLVRYGLDGTLNYFGRKTLRSRFAASESSLVRWKFMCSDASLVLQMLWPRFSNLPTWASWRLFAEATIQIQNKILIDQHKAEYLLSPTVHSGMRPSLPCLGCETRCLDTWCQKHSFPFGIFPVPRTAKGTDENCAK